MLIEPDIVPTSGKFEAANNGDNEATFKQYKELATKTLERIQHLELVTVNPMIPTVSSLNQEIRIIGIARERVETL